MRTLLTIAAVAMATAAHAAACDPWQRNSFGDCPADGLIAKAKADADQRAWAAFHEEWRRRMAAEVADGKFCQEWVDAAHKNVWDWSVCMQRLGHDAQRRGQ